MFNSVHESFDFSNSGCWLKQHVILATRILFLLPHWYHFSLNSFTDSYLDSRILKLCLYFYQLSSVFSLLASLQSPFHSTLHQAWSSYVSSMQVFEQLYSILRYPTSFTVFFYYFRWFGHHVELLVSLVILSQSVFSLSLYISCYAGFTA